LELQLLPNRFKTGIRERSPQIGFWSSLCSNIVAEILSASGYEWVLLDSEHAPNEIPGLLSQLQAMVNGTAEPVVRCAWNDTVLIKRTLDIGARSVLIPFVQNAEEARRAVVAARYPPRGSRGVSVAPRANLYGRVPRYHDTAHEDTCVLIQVETAAALKEIEKIAEVDGVDGIFIGPSDLAADMGHLGNNNHPEVQDTIADACRRIRAAGKPVGTLVVDASAGARFFEMGFTFIAIGSDVGTLGRGSEALYAECREKMKGRMA
jgi:4-hydroxy-2-oxoheptanedioate aldolase